MPSTKKRINLTVPDDIYQQIQEYKKENALFTDAAACLQLVVLQLRGQENEKMLRRVLTTISPEQLQAISMEGLNYLCSASNETKE